MLFDVPWFHVTDVHISFANNRIDFTEFHGTSTSKQMVKLIPIPQDVRSFMPGILQKNGLVKIRNSGLWTLHKVLKFQNADLFHFSLVSLLCRTEIELERLRDTKYW